MPACPIDSRHLRCLAALYKNQRLLQVSCLESKYLQQSTRFV